MLMSTHFNKTTTTTTTGVKIRPPLPTAPATFFSNQAMTDGPF